MTLALITYMILTGLAVGFFWALCRAAGNSAPHFAPLRDARAGAPLSHIRELVLLPEGADAR